MERKDYILHVSVDTEKVKKQAETTNLEEAIRSEAGWMEQSGIYLEDIKEDKTAPTVCVYQEYNDALPFGEQVLEHYANREIAIKKLKQSVEKKFGVPFDEVPGSAEFDEQDTFKEDYVSYYDGSTTWFWSVVELPLLSQIQE